MVLDTLLTSLKALGYPVRAFGSDKIENCIVYNFAPMTNDGVKAQDRLELTVISTQFATGQAMLKQVKDALLTVGDNRFSDEILSIVLNGGGALENLATNTYHFKAYFTVLSRYRKD